MHHFIRYFVRGLIVVVPVAVTAWVLVQVFVWIDSLVPFAIPGTGFALTIMTIVTIGFLASNIVTKKLFDVIEVLFSRAPIARILYVSIRDFVEAFVGDRKKFNRPVLVRLAGEVQAVGFLTREDLAVLGLGALLGRAAGDQVLQQVAQAPAEPSPFVDAAGVDVAPDRQDGRIDALGDDRRAVGQRRDDLVLLI
ncbi:MAG: DUF502 domain-containing protein, partial [Acidobacteria bacterium]|nr:DUF502 domain-containing protein [Acidobacteriota bacterium]